MAFKKPHAFSRDELLKNAAPVSAFVAAAPVEAPPPRPAEPAPLPHEATQGGGMRPKNPKTKTAQVREGFKKETVIFPLKLSNKIRELGEVEFKDFSNMTRDLVLFALKKKGVSLD